MAEANLIPKIFADITQAHRPLFVVPCALNEPSALGADNPPQFAPLNLSTMRFISEHMCAGRK
jgi:hypothetical protein